MSQANFQDEINVLENQLSQIRQQGDGNLPESQTGDHRAAECEILGKLGMAYYQTQQWPEAVATFTEYLNAARDLGNQWQEAVAQYYVGFSQIAMSKPCQAVEAFSLAYDLFRQQGQDEFSSQVWQQLSQQGQAYFEQKQFDEALALYKQQLRLLLKFDDLKAANWVAINISKIYYNQEEFDSAISGCLEVLDAAQTFKDRSMESLSLAWLGCSYRELGQLEQCLDYFERRLAISQELGDRAAQKETLGWLIDISKRSQKFDRTLKYYQVQLGLFRELRELVSEYTCLYDSASLQFDIQQCQEALSGFESALQIAKSLDEDSQKSHKIANCQYMLGQCHENLDHKKQAIEHYQQAANLYADLGVKDWEVKALSSIGSLYRYLKQYEQSIKIQEKRLRLVRELNNRLSEQSCLYDFGCIFNDNKEWNKAVEYFEKSLILASNLERKQDQANAHYMLGLCFKTLENFELSQKHFKNALTLYEETGNKKWIENSKDILYKIKRKLIGIADSCIQEGINFNKVQNFDQAIIKFEKALNIYQELNCPSSQATALGNLGSVYRECKDFDKSVDALRQAIAIEQNTQNRIMEAFYLNTISLTYQENSEFYQTIECLKRSLEIQTEQDDVFGKMRSLKRIGDVYKKIKKNSDSIEFYTQAFECVSFQSEYTIKFQLKVLQELSDFLFIGENKHLILSFKRCLKVAEKNVNKEKCFDQFSPRYNQSRNKYFVDQTVVMTCLSYLGIAYSGGMNYNLALQCYEKHLELLETMKDKSHYLPNKGSALNNLAGVLRQLGRYQESLQCLNQCIEIKQIIQDKLGEDKAWARMGDLYRSLGQPYQAITAYERALEISNELNNFSRKRSNLISLGRCYLGLRQPDEAINFLNLSNSDCNKSEHYEHSANHVDNDNTYYDLAQAYLLKGDYQKALKFTDLAFCIAEEKSNQESLANCYSILGHINLIQKDYKQAKKFLHQSLFYDQKSGLKIGEYHSLAKLAFVSFCENDMQNAEKLLFQSIDLLENFRLDLDDKHKISLDDDQNYAYQLLQQVLVCQNKCKQALEISERGRARAFVELLNKRLFNKTESSLIKYPSFKKIQKIAINNKVVLVEYSIIDNRNLLLIWLIKPTGELRFQQVNLQNYNLNLLVLKSRQNMGIDDEIKKEERDIIDSLPSSQGTHLFKIFYEILIKPIENDLPKDPEIPVILIPQDTLFLLPFACLKCDDGKYLSEHHSITVLPSIQSFDCTQKYKNNLNNIFTKSNSLAQSELVIVGNPLMPNNPQSVPPTRLPQLPGTEIEAEAISKIFNANPLIGQAATKTKITQKMPHARFIHLATHGLFHDIQQVGIPGAVALAPDEDDNGFLTSGEIYDMKLKANLVVLSACNTGQGKLTSDGVIGLSRCLLAAGASNVIVSLWEVNDLSTAIFMIQFYQILQNQPELSVVLALQQTQKWLRDTTVQDLLEWVDSCAVISPERRKQMKFTLQWGYEPENKPFSSPYYWAAFCAIGQSN